MRRPTLGDAVLDGLAIVSWCVDGGARRWRLRQARKARRARVLERARLEDLEARAARNAAERLEAEHRAYIARQERYARERRWLAEWEAERDRLEALDHERQMREHHERAVRESWSRDAAEDRPHA